ncbi:histone protein [Streptomyces xantholiticus]|uniref:Histone protein n=1 Tax=Streptomyces xantholiticus TaxID=68285 RepID=A0ABV1UUD9_9ACTN
MKDTTKLAVGAAVAGGYVLGRAKKGRLAFAVATYLTGRRLGLDPQQLITGGVQKLKDAPQLAGLGDQVRGELMDAGRQALAASADRRLAGLADSLHQRTRLLEERDEGDEEDEQDRDEDETERDQDQEQADERGEPPGRRGAAKKSAPSPGKRAGDQAPSKKTAPKKTAAKKTATKRAPGQKAPAKKAAGGKASAGKSPSSSGSRRR